jgi:hypothetical protein
MYCTTYGAPLNSVVNEECDGTFLDKIENNE